ncbi:MAG: response regulator [Chloroflexota bacterium]
MEDTTILVVDDEPIMLVLIERSLEGPGRRIVPLSGAETIVDAAVRESADVVVLDVLMPRVDGLTACRQLRGDPRTADIPIVLLSAKSSPRDIDAGLHAGADRYVPKPFEPSKLARLITDLARHSH